jgi:hypothetical protein
MSYYLLDNENPNAIRTENGKQGWYYPKRLESIRGFVFHTAETTVASEVASYYAKSNRKSSVHVLVDDQQVIEMLPDDFTAFHTDNENSMSLGVELCYKADDWGKNSGKEHKIINNCAQWIAQKVIDYEIPFRKLTTTEWNSGMKGFISHYEFDRIKRKDPGLGYDWLLLFDLAQKWKTTILENKS